MKRKGGHISIKRLEVFLTIITIQRQRIWDKHLLPYQGVKACIYVLFCLFTSFSSTTITFHISYPFRENFPRYRKYKVYMKCVYICLVLYSHSILLTMTISQLTGILIAFQSGKRRESMLITTSQQRRKPNLNQNP